MNHFTYYQLFPLMLTSSFLQMTDEQNMYVKDYLSGLESEEAGFSSKNKFILNDKKLSFFRDIIMNEFNDFKNSIMQFNDTTFEMTTSWFTETPKEHFSDFHNHSNSMFSGVFYFDDSSDIEFRDFSTRQFYVVPNKYNDFNCDAYTIQPKKNMIIFFDSRLYHKVTVNNLDKTRYSLAFNVIPTSDINLGDSQICFKLDLDK